jgi:quinohemoprotein amine dehydrogenase
MAGKGDFEGVMTTKAVDADRYSVTFDARFSNGEKLEGNGDAIVYTGYEWRANLRLGDVRYLQVLASDAAGTALTGRMFMADHEERGIDLDAMRDDGKPRLIAVVPTNLQRGRSATVTLVGVGLSGKPSFGDGVRVGKILARDADRVVVEAVASADAPIGKRAISVGKTTLADGLTIFDRVDRLEVSPAYAVGRVGGEGSQPEVQARFEAIAWSNGADGNPGTADDVEIGPVDATWSIAPWDEKAAEDQDLRYAGAMDKDSGIFTPAAAGPNPQRKYTTNNAGNLKVIASWNGGEKPVIGEGHLLVTVQRWNNPPIR